VVGGDIFKMGFLNKHMGRKTLTVATVGVDRLCGVYTLIAIGFISSLVGYKYLGDQLTYYVLGVFVIGVITIGLIYYEKFWEKFWRVTQKLLKGNWISKLKGLVETVQSFKISDQSIKNAIYMSVFFYLSVIAANILVAKSFNLNISPIVFFVFVPIISLSGMIPISISGLGVREYVSVLFFSALSVEPQYGMLLSLMPFIFRSIFGAIGGMLYLFNTIEGK
jgi:uncharacterized membrane protein YbhN (UPF0104 family)